MLAVNGSAVQAGVPEMTADWAICHNGRLFIRSDAWEVAEMIYGEWAAFAPRADNISKHYPDALTAMTDIDRRYPMQGSQRT